ncbi:uncharacterized protein LOC108677465 [Hyalella azteca]|uniref:Uncharacterized protein LOC108677465 n=1 Tax=Hyalella azteca TaxID=294128 RepID=A0A979FP08_HYAAZ|nr:uncharacterized protein LOC108677465 [Hyalella azteca]
MNGHNSSRRRVNAQGGFISPDGLASNSLLGSRFNGGGSNDAHFNSRSFIDRTFDSPNSLMLSTYSSGSNSNSRSAPHGNNRYNGNSRFGGNVSGSNGCFDNNSRFDGNSRFDSNRFDGNSCYDSNSRFDGSSRFNGSSRFDSNARFDGNGCFDGSGRFNNSGCFDGNVRFESKSRFDTHGRSDNSNGMYRASAGDFFSRSHQAPAGDSCSPLMGGGYRSSQPRGFWAQADARVRNSPIAWGNDAPGPYAFDSSRNAWQEPSLQPAFGATMGGVLGYLGIHNLKEGKSGLFVITYLNHLVRTRLLHRGPDVVLHSRLDEHNLALVFPSLELLRACVERLSPIMVKGKVVVYVTHKPSIQNYTPALLAPVPPPRRAGPAVGPRVVTRGRTSNPIRMRGAPIQTGRLMATRIAPPKGREAKGLSSPRPRGVFPDGVQPSRVVLVVDEASTVALLGRSCGDSETSPLAQLETDLAALALSDSETAGGAEGSTPKVAATVPHRVPVVPHVVRDHIATPHKALELLMQLPLLQEDNNLFVVAPSLAWVFAGIHALVAPRDALKLSALQVGEAGAPQGRGEERPTVTPPTSRKKKVRSCMQVLKEVVADHGSVSSADQALLARAPKFPAGSLDNAPDGDLPLLRLLLRHLVHGALTIRSGVKAQSHNSEVVFAPLAPLHLTGDKVAQVLTNVMNASAAASLASVAAVSVSLYNAFACNTWLLGGYTCPLLHETVKAGSTPLVEKSGDLSPQQLRHLEETFSPTRGPSQEDVAATLLGNIKSVKREDLSKEEGLLKGKTFLTGEVEEENMGIVDLAPLGDMELLGESRAVVHLSHTRALSAAIGAVQSLIRRKGALVPWGGVEVEEVSREDLPDVITQAVATCVYSVYSCSGQQEEYTCVACGGATVGAAVAADAHAYTRRHVHAVRRFLRNKNNDNKDTKNTGSLADDNNEDNNKTAGKNNKKSVLTGTAAPKVFVPIKKDYLSCLIAFKVIKTTSGAGGGEGDTRGFICLLCSPGGNKTPTQLDMPGLRFHLHSPYHRKQLNQLLGVPVHRALLNQQLDWPMYCRRKRHPELRVVIVSDDIHRPSLRAGLGAFIDKVHLVTVPSLLSPPCGTLVLKAGLDALGGASAVWVLVGGRDVIAPTRHLTAPPTVSTQQLLAGLVQLQAQLRVQLPPTHLVLVAPLLPLQLLEEEKEGLQLPELLTNCITAVSTPVVMVSTAVPPAVSTAVSDCYFALQRQAMRLHRASASLSNIRGFSNVRVAPHPSSSLVPAPSVTPIASLASSPAIFESEWQVAMRHFVAAAATGLPTIWPRPLDQEDPRASVGPVPGQYELHSTISHVVFVSPKPYLKKGSRFSSAKPLTVEWTGDMDDGAVAAIRAKASAADLGEGVVWYIVCSLSSLLLCTARPLQCCTHNNCTSPIPAYTLPPRWQEECGVKMTRVWEFLTQLTCELPRGNFVGLAPPFPQGVVRVPHADPVTHAAVHALASSGAMFTETDAGELSRGLQAAAAACSDLIVKTNLHTSLPEDLLSPVLVQELEEAVAGTPEGPGLQWCRVINALTASHCSTLQVELNDVAPRLLSAAPSARP